MKALRVHLKDGGYSVFIEAKGLQKLADHIIRHHLGEHAAVISDETVSGLYGHRVIEALGRKGICCELHVVPDGETSKSLDQISKLYTKLIESKLGRDDFIIALGGGVIGDLAGFIAATYLRGIKWIQVPTTLLAQVDSSVGGKVGINHALGKNLIGSFYQPSFVVIDPSVLVTLEERELWAGMGEVVKYGLIRDGDLFSSLEINLDTLVTLADMDAIIEIIFICCSIKSEIVERDEKEIGLRRILNFGHTLGHALETETNYAYFRHGEAIVHGMHWASWISLNMGYLSESVFRRIETLLERMPVPNLPKGLKAERLASHIASDKKQSTAGLNLIILEDIGSTTVVKIESITELIETWPAFKGK